MWTRFSWTGHGEPLYKDAYIEADSENAKLILFNRTGNNPMDARCYCCGQNYSYEEYSSLEEATAEERGCLYNEDTDRYEERYGWNGTGHYETLEEYVLRDNVLVIQAEEITEADISGELPEPYFAEDHDDFDELEYDNEFVDEDDSVETNSYW